MAGWSKILFIFLIILLFGALSYLGWFYFTNRQLILKFYTDKSIDVTPSPSYTVVDENPATERFEGLVFCLKDIPKDTPLTFCEEYGLILDDNRSYRLVESQIDVSVFSEKERVFVMGIRASGPSISGPTDGTIFAYEISKF